MGDAAWAASPHHPIIKRSVLVQAAPARTSALEQMWERDGRSFVESLCVCGFRHEIFGHRLKAIG
ncbi:MAG TPA: hypothetical protein VLN57_14885 [Xanthobacteraceae bacterium]|jgi:hypothetical protein|nr:hypothetical protein [Xanthobacteraceae bacterium]